MAESSQSQFGDAAFWKRTLLMILFGIAYSIVEFVIALTVLVQFVSILATGRANEALLRFGNSLSAYVRQILRFVLYNTEDMPFPFADWPDEPAGGERWRQGVGAAEDSVPAPAPAPAAATATAAAPAPGSAPADPPPPEAPDRASGTS